MDAKPYGADIQCKSSFITECSIENNVINLVSDATLDHQIKVSVSEPTPSEDSSDEKEAYVRLTLDGLYSVNNHSDASCKYHLVVNGSFSVANEVPDTDFIQKLWFNGSATLYSIARAKLEVISSMVLNYGKILLPMVNMYELLKAQAEENNK